MVYQYNANGNRISRTQSGVTDYYGVDAANRLHWVNRGRNGAPNPSLGDTDFTIYTYNGNGMQSRRERWTGGAQTQNLWFWWDGDDRLRKVTTTNSPSGPLFFSGTYNGDGLRVKKQDTRGGSLQQHDYTWGPGGLLHETNPTTIYTPGFGHRSNGEARFYHLDWLGSTRYVTSTNGSVWTEALAFDAWGKRLAGEGLQYHPTDLQFAAEWGYQTEWSRAMGPRAKALTELAD